MSDHRGLRVPGGTYFCTVSVLERRGDLRVLPIEDLGEAVRRTGREPPPYHRRWVVLRDHVHCVITLPDGGRRLVQPAQGDQDPLRPRRAV